MSWFDSFFGDKETKESTSTQSGESSYGLTPEVMDYWKRWAGTFGPDAWNNVGPDPYQTSAAQAQQAFAPMMMPAYGTAMGVANNGILPGISAFQNQYTQDVVDAYNRDFDDRRGKTLAQNSAYAAKAGVPLMGSSQGAVNRSLTEGELERVRSGQVANLYQGGYDRAVQASTQDINARLAGAQGAVGAANAASGANQASFGQGTQFWNQGWQNAMMPYQMAQWGAGLLGGLIPGSGQRSSGTSTGTQTSTASPSPFSTAANVFGGAIAGGWRPFGFAQGGAVEPYRGSSRKGPDDRLAKSFRAIHGMITRARGGSVHMHAGGIVPQGAGDEYRPPVSAAPQPMTSMPATGLPPPVAAPQVPTTMPGGGISAAPMPMQTMPATGPMQAPNMPNITTAGGSPVMGAPNVGTSMPATGFLPPPVAAPPVTTSMPATWGTPNDGGEKGGIYDPVASWGSRPYADGGAVGSRDATVTPAKKFDYKAFGDTLTKMGGSPSGSQDNGSFLRDQQASLAQMMSGLHRPGMADGGVPDDDWGRLSNARVATGVDVIEPYEDRLMEGPLVPVHGAGTVDLSPSEYRPTPAPASAPRPRVITAPTRGPSDTGTSLVARGDIGRPAPTSGGFSTPERKEPAATGWFRGGIWDGQEATPMQRLGMAMMSIKGPRFGGPMNGFAESLMASNADALKRRQAEEEGRQFQKRIDHEAAQQRARLAQAQSIADRSYKLDSSRLGLEERRVSAAESEAALDRDIKEFKLDEMKHPERAYERRAVMAEKMGLKPDHPAYLSFMAEGKIPAKLLEKGSLGPYDNMKDRASVEAGLRKEVSSYAKDYVTIRDAASTVNSIATSTKTGNAGEGTPFGDIALIFSYMKLLDPGSVVREGEFANAQNAGSVPDRVVNLYNQALKGTLLNETQRKDILDQAAKVARTKREFYESKLGQYKEVAKRVGVDWRNVILEEPRPTGGKGRDPAQTGSSPTSEAPPVPGARKAHDGEWYVSDPNNPGKYLKVIP